MIFEQREHTREWRPISGGNSDILSHCTDGGMGFGTVKQRDWPDHVRDLAFLDRHGTREHRGGVPQTRQTVSVKDVEAWVKAWQLLDVLI